MAVLRYLADELADALPANRDELSGFVKGAGWMLTFVIVLLVVSTVAYTKLSGG